MRALICTWIVCVSVAFTAVAFAAPGVDARAKYQAAQVLSNNGNAAQALIVIEEGLAVAPKDRPLLSLKGKVLLELRDYLGALTAYDAYLAAGPIDGNARQVQEIVKNLLPAKTTSLDITLANGPADIYLDSKTLGPFCAATSSCNKAMLPGPHRVIVERPGFNRWTGSVTVVAGETTKLEVALVETPSLLTVRVAQPDAQVTVDGTAYNAPTKVAAGSHQVVVSLARYLEARLEATAHEGKPVELDVSLTPLVATRVEPPGAELLLDDKPVTIADGNLPIPQGAHVLVARAKGFQERRTDIPAERPADYEVKIELAPIPLPEAPKVVVVPPKPSPWTPRRKLARAVGGVGVAAAVTGMVLGVQSGHLEDDAYARCPAPATPCSGAREANDLIQRGQSRALQANIAYGVAGGAAVAAAVLWLTGASESPSRVAVMPRVGAVAGLDLAVRF
jgi:PEGA domain